ncbi:MAG: PLP-dependent transferase [Caldilineales bacterium]|nr:PLP-dependent transferase [Caldilineales bacterium]
MKFETLTVHSGHQRQGGILPSSPPIERAASWAFDAMADLDAVFEDPSSGYDYGRDNMPTPALLEEAISALQGGGRTQVFATGMAAIAAVLATAGSGRRVLAAPDLYGATYAMLNAWLPESGGEVRFVSAQDHEAVRDALQNWRPHLLVVETLSNPLVKVSDLGWLVEQARSAGCKTLVDNTFASPYLCRPLELGADYVVESLTKYLNGHGDVLGGSVTVNDDESYTALNLHRKRFGATLDPQAAWLTLRGIRTLALRLHQQCSNALVLAEFLSGHPAVATIYYPGLDSHPGHETAARLFGGRGYGGVLAFDLDAGTRAAAWAVMERLQIAWRAATLGDVATLVAYPAHASHRALTVEQRQAIGIGDGLIRVSVGIEDPDDIIDDFAQALDD